MLIKVGPLELKTAFHSFISKNKLAPRLSSSEPHKQVSVGLTKKVHSNKNVCKFGFNLNFVYKWGILILCRNDQLLVKVNTPCCVDEVVD